MTPRKLLIVATIPDTITGFLLPFAQHFRSQGWQVDALAQGAPQCSDCIGQFDQLWDIQWSRNPLDPRNLIVAAPALRQLVEQEAYDLVHVHTPVAAFVTRWALRQLRRDGKVKVVYTAHGFHFHRHGGWLKNWIFSQLEQWAGPWTDRLVVINKEDQQAAYTKRLVPNPLGQGHRVTYMPGIGIDLSHYHRDMVEESAVNELYEELQLPINAPLAVCVAEFVTRKRHVDVLHAFAKAGCHQAHLLLAGDGPLLPDMKKLAQQLKIADRVHFLGERRDVPRLLRASTVLVLASQQEGLPRCVMEAMAMGKAVVGTRIRGTADLLAAGGGVLVELGDRQAMAAALKQFLEQPSLAAAVGQQGQQLVKAYDVQQIIEQHGSLYQDLLGSESASTASPFSWSHRLNFLLKSLFDRSAAAIALLLLSPVMLLVASAIYITMGGPVLFCQPRPGQDGRVFSVYKFRTMVPGDETAPDVHRITPLGDWLRRLSLDELPQLFNVLKGDMSVIGPRPLIMCYLPRYSEEQARRHLIKPGITGLAQVSGRNTIDWERKFQLDLNYIEQWSWGMEFKVLYLTLLKVLGQADINQEDAAVITVPEFWGSMAPAETHLE